MIEPKEDLLTKLLEIIEDGDAPAISELRAGHDLVDDYYQRLANVILEEKEKEIIDIHLENAAQAQTKQIESGEGPALCELNSDIPQGFLLTSTKELPANPKRRKLRLIVFNPSIYIVYYDTDTKQVSNTKFSKPITDFEWWLDVTGPS